MFALAADYLMGWAMASADGARKQQPEWPPHPDRVYMALAAAWFETGCDAAEGDVLRWLEALPPPALCASGHQARSNVTHYVPVNDVGVSSMKAVEAILNAGALSMDKAKRAGLAQLPEFRSRQPRSFPVAVPHHPLVHWVWAVALPDHHQAALATLCAKVTCIGHSASLVRMWVEPGPPSPTWTPGEGTTAVRLRVSSAGRLAYLERRMNKQSVLAYASMKQALQDAKGKAKEQLQQQLETQFPVLPVSLRPEPGRWQAYLPATPPLLSERLQHSVFDDRLVILSLSGPRLNVLSTLQLTAALRGAMLAGCAQPLPAWLSGHEPDGAPSRDPHVALLPLAFAGKPHADGRLLGIALALPRSVTAAEAAHFLEPWLRQPDDGQAREFRVFNGRGLECSATLDLRERPPATLSANVWTSPARRWATVTPIVLDRHGTGASAREQATRVVSDACLHIGLPRPVRVELHGHSCIVGVPPSRSFAPIQRKSGGGRLAHTHAVITFDSEVIGPIVLGAGRFRGYGLCRPFEVQGGNDG